MLTVWGRASSSNVQAVMWGSAEMGLPVHRIDVGGRFGGVDDPGFRAMNPMGLVPVLQDGEGPALFESAAILRYLAARYGAAPFWPEDALARAGIDVWAEWGKHVFCGAFTVPVFWAHWRTPARDRDVEAVAGAVRRFEALMEIVAPRIARGGFVVGEHLSLADLWVGHVLYRYFTLDIDRAPHPEIAAYYRRLCLRPDYATHVMVNYDELKGVRR
ncbi:Glutathione S-transferase GstB [Marinibacterium anthonyi]|nr:Glutathione S-transferase GstB [Marinibacterium anthonyi]